MKKDIRDIMKSGIVTVGKGKNKVSAWSNTIFTSELTIAKAMDYIHYAVRKRLPVPLPVIEMARYSEDYDKLALAGMGYSYAVYRDPESAKVVPLLDENKNPILNDDGTAKTQTVYSWRHGNPSSDGMHDDILTNIVTPEQAIRIDSNLMSSTGVMPTVDLPPLPETHPVSVLRRYGFRIGDRDPSVNPDFEGKFMVTDGEKGGFSIVGDDLDDMAREAVDSLELESRYIYVPALKSRLTQAAKENYRLDPILPPDDIWPEFHTAAANGHDLPDAAVDARIEGYETLAGARSAIAFSPNMEIVRVPAKSDLDGWIKVENDSSFKGDRRYITTPLSLDNSDVFKGIDRPYHPTSTAYPQPQKTLSHEP